MKTLTTNILLVVVAVLVFSACESEEPETIPKSSWEVFLPLDAILLLYREQPLLADGKVIHCSDSALFIHDIENGTLLKKAVLPHEPVLITPWNNTILIAYQFINHDEGFFKDDSTLLECRSIHTGQLLKQNMFQSAIRGIHSIQDSSHALLTYTDNSIRTKGLKTSLYHVKADSMIWTTDHTPFVPQPYYYKDYIYYLVHQDSLLTIHKETGQVATKTPSDLPRYMVLLTYGSKKQREWRIWDNSTQQLLENNWQSHTSTLDYQVLLPKQSDSVLTIVADTISELVFPYPITHMSSHSSPSKQGILLYSDSLPKEILYHNFNTRTTQSYSIDYPIEECAYFNPITYDQNSLLYTTMKRGSYHLIRQPLELE